MDETVPTNVASSVLSSLISFETIPAIFSSFTSIQVVDEVVCNHFLWFETRTTFKSYFQINENLHAESLALSIS